MPRENTLRLHQSSKVILFDPSITSVKMLAIPAMFRVTRQRRLTIWTNAAIQREKDSMTQSKCFTHGGCLPA